MSVALKTPSAAAPAAEATSFQQPLPETLDGKESNSSTSRGQGFRVFTLLLGWVPSAVVLGLLAAIGWYGHHHDWKLPSVASLSGTTIDEGVGWCDSHGVPEDACVVCDPSLIEPPPKLTFCSVHGVHGCVLDRPELAQTKVPVEATEQDLRRAAQALALLPRPENIPVGSSAGARIQFASIDAMNKAGVDVEPVTRERVVEAIDVAAEVRYDATRSASVSPPSDGVVRRILVEIGQSVEAGDPLAIVDSQAIGQLKTELSAARANQQLAEQTVTRLEPLAGTAIPGKRLLEAKNDLQQARSDVDRILASLTNLGVDESNTSAGNEIAVVAPLPGQVVALETSVGEVVDRGSVLFRVVDPRKVWLDLRVPAEQASLVSKGQTVRYTPDGSSATRTGEVFWISTDVDAETRTVRTRVVLDNADGALRNESFGRGRIVLRESDDAIVVPEEAVQWDGSSFLVFVRDARFFEEDRPKFFIARSVRPGVRGDGTVEMIAGVLPGEVVTTKGSDVLRAQLLRSNLGAGCTCGH